MALEPFRLMPWREGQAIPEVVNLREVLRSHRLLSIAQAMDKDDSSM
jgi:hypothetical protein